MTQLNKLAHSKDSANPIGKLYMTQLTQYANFLWLKPSRQASYDSINPVAKFLIIQLTSPASYD